MSRLPALLGLLAMVTASAVLDVVSDIETRSATERARPSRPTRGAQPPEADAKTVRIQPMEGGWSVVALVELVARSGGPSILFDPHSATVKAARVHFVGDVVIPEAELLGWFQSVLLQQRLVLIPTGSNECPGGSQWRLVDEACDLIWSHPTVVAERDLAAYRGRDGLFITTVLHIPEGVDSTQVRNTLSPLATQYAGIGRLQNAPSAQALVVSDFAPVVWAMKGIVDRLAAAPPPRIRE